MASSYVTPKLAVTVTSSAGMVKVVSSAVSSSSVTAGSAVQLTNP